VGALGEPQHSVISQPRYPADLHLLLRYQAARLQFIRQPRPLSDEEGGVSTRESGVLVVSLLLPRLSFFGSSWSRHSLCLHSLATFFAAASANNNINNISMSDIIVKFAAIELKYVIAIPW
jgi:hypothetical protein